MRRTRVLVGCIAAAFVLSACGSKKEVETRGTIAEVDGRVRVLSANEIKSVCENNFCEPNYVYHASFGRKSPQLPPPAQPAPVPVPSPPPVQPEPNPTPIGGGPTIPETLDYSRQILRMEQAWLTAKGSRNVIVAVVDTGIEVNHPDLVNNIWRNETEAAGRAGVDDDGNGFVDDVYGWDFANNRPNGIDDNRHGTHCAGIIGAELNGIGVVGVAQRVRMMPLKFLDRNGSGTTDAAVAAINYAVANGAKIISNSWGGGGRSELLNQAIQNAINRGVIVIAAAGNDSSNNDSTATYPANYSGVLAVASTDQFDRLSSFSNFGTRLVEIAAPGSNILSTVTRGSWAELSGTSMATPQVAGAMALALSIRPGASFSQLRGALCSSAQKILLNSVGCGRMDVNSFLQTVQNL